MSGHPPERPRTIIRRSRPAVGMRRERQIVRRPRGGVEAAAATSGPRARNWLVWTIPAVLVLLVTGGVFFAWLSPAFEIDSIAVEGNQRVDAAAIAEQSGLAGENIFTADLSAAQERLYQLPLLKSAKVERSWPSGISITVEERQAWGTWVQGGVRYSIDREGVVLGTEAAPEGSPVVVSSEAGSRLQGDRVDYQAVEAAAELFQQLPSQLGTTAATVTFVAGKGIQVTTADGQTALLGDSSSIGYKLAVWSAMAKTAREQQLPYTSIDLRFGNRPVLIP